MQPALTIFANALRVESITGADEMNVLVNAVIRKASMDPAKTWNHHLFEQGRPATAEAKSSSTWFALRNPVFCRLWLACVLSGTFVCAQDVTATWLMHDLGASSLALSLMATAASAPFFLFTLPAGAVADIVNRRAFDRKRFAVAGSLLSSPCLWSVDRCA